MVWDVVSYFIHSGAGCYRFMDFESTTVCVTMPVPRNRSTVLCRYSVRLQIEFLDLAEGAWI